jgi:pilus assembly protein FimV
MQARAFALGDLTVQSTLGAPLRAEIRVLDIGAEEAATLRAVVATPATFLAAGADYNPSLSAVSISVASRQNGAHVLLLSSTRPMHEEFVDLIIEATASSGRVLRDYTLHLAAKLAAPKP